jgi:hypothetical protein
MAIRRLGIRPNMTTASTKPQRLMIVMTPDQPVQFLLSNHWNDGIEYRKIARNDVLHRYICYPIIIHVVQSFFWRHILWWSKCRMRCLSISQSNGSMLWWCIGAVEMLRLTGTRDNREICCWISKQRFAFISALCWPLWLWNWSMP